MIRPCYLVLDREYPGSISTRKLVIETAKLNVITAYDPEEAVAMLETFPRVNGVVINSEVARMSSEELIRRLRSKVAGIPVIVVSPHEQPRSQQDVRYVTSLDPKALLDCIQSLNPKEVQEIAARDPQIPQ